jgi:hypothetical protein
MRSAEIRRPPHRSHRGVAQAAAEFLALAAFFDSLAQIGR